MELWLIVESGKSVLYGNGIQQASFESVEMAKRFFPNVRWKIQL